MTSSKSSIIKDSLRYPASRYRYTTIVGDILVRTLVRIFHDELGYTVLVNPLQANNTDMVVLDKGELLYALEVINWGMPSYMSSRHYRNITSNLSEFKCPKFLVASFRTNLGKYEEEIEKEGITIIEIGFQLVPLSYYLWYKARGLEHDKKPLTRNVYKHIKKLVYAYVYNPRAL